MMTMDGGETMMTMDGDESFGPTMMGWWGNQL